MKKLATIILILFVTLGTSQAVFAASGAIWTTDKNGITQDKNQYGSKADVYIHGQKLNQGIYYLDVYQTAGNVMIGSTNGASIAVDVSGNINPPVRLYDFVYSSSSGYTELGFNDSRNNEYKVEIGYIDEKNNKHKISSDNFKVKTPEITTTEPTSAPDEVIATQAPESTVAPTQTPESVVTATPAPVNTVAPTQTPVNTVAPTSTPAITATATPAGTDIPSNLTPAGGTNPAPKNLIAEIASKIPAALPITSGTPAMIFVGTGLLILLVGLVIAFFPSKKFAKK